MDAKTFDYMKQRTDKWEDIQNRINKLKELIKRINLDKEYNSTTFSTGYYTTTIHDEESKQLREAIIESSEKQITVLEKQLEEI